MTDETRQGAFGSAEKVHVVEHRRFEADLRRHFVGEIEHYDANHLRLRGFLFVFEQGSGQFVKVPPQRTRVFSIDNRISLTVLPEAFDLENSTYQRNGTELVFTDGKTLELELGAFGSHG